MSLAGALRKYLSGYAVLQETHKGFWTLQLVGLLDTMAYWSMVGIIVITLSDDFGFSDVDAGRLYTLAVISTTASFLFAGSVVDALGVRRTLLLGYLGSLLSRGALFAAVLCVPGVAKTWVVALALVAMGPCVAALQTIYSVGSQLFAGRQSRGAGFNVVYIGLNLGAAAAGLMIDFFYLGLGLPRFYILGAAALIALVCLGLTLAGVPGEADRAGRSHTATPGIRPTTGELIGSAFRQPMFWRLIVLMVLLTPVRASLIYYVLLAPKYWLRMIGPQANIGVYEALNPILVVVGTVLFIPYLARADTYRAIAVGSLVSACSLFFLAVPVLDTGDIDRHTAFFSLLFIVGLTIGEFTWAPRLWEYTAAIAPPGLEATFLGVSGLPLGLSKMGIAFFSGYMLDYWCPPDVASGLSAGTIGYWQSPAAMWLLLAVLAALSASAILVLRDWLTRGTRFHRA